jgi:hypothetical protein
MKITKILVALSFLFATVTASAGELTVTGNMETTYHSTTSGVTGNPLGMDKELKFAGSTELDNGITVSVMQDTGEATNNAFVFGNSQISFGNIMLPFIGDATGAMTIYVGSDSDPVDGIDDVTPTAYEEANGSGSGSYVDIGSNAGQTGLGVKMSLPYLGAVNYKHYPRINSNEIGDNSNSGGTSQGSAMSVSIVTDLGVLGVDGLTLTTGYSKADDQQQVANDSEEGTVAVNYTYGPIKVGYQKKVHTTGQTGVGATDTAPEYKDDIIGIAYAVNDALSISYNRMESYRFGADLTQGDQDNNTQKTDAWSIGYAVGGMTIGFQEAKTSNDGWVKNTDDDRRTLGLSVAF